MSQEGQLTFFSISAAADIGSTIVNAVRLTGSEKVWLLSRTLDEDRSWENWRRAVEAGFSDVQGADEGSPDFEIIARNIDPHDVAKHYMPSRNLTLQFSGTPLGTRLRAALTRDIPERLSRSFVPSDPSITVGWHDIWEASEHDDGSYFGRAFVSFSLGSYGTPSDWKEYRTRVFEVSVVKDVKARVEAIVGPCQQCVYWSV